eukprot:2333342-Prymnesium_polylepis.1
MQRVLLIVPEASIKNVIVHMRRTHLRQSVQGSTPWIARGVAAALMKQLGLQRAARREHGGGREGCKSARHGAAVDSFRRAQGAGLPQLATLIPPRPRRPTCCREACPRSR